MPSAKLSVVEEVTWLASVTLAVFNAIAVFCVVCSPCNVEILVALVAIPVISWSPVLVPLVFAITVAWAGVIPALAVFNAIAVFWVVCSPCNVEILVALVAIPVISWSPVLVPLVLLKVVISVVVILFAGLAV